VIVSRVEKFGSVNHKGRLGVGRGRGDDEERKGSLTSFMRSSSSRRFSSSVNLDILVGERRRVV